MCSHCFSIVLFTSGSAILHRECIMEIGFVSCIANGKACESGVICIVHVLKISVGLSIESVRSLRRVTF